MNKTVNRKQESFIYFSHFYSFVINRNKTGIKLSTRTQAQPAEEIFSGGLIFSAPLSQNGPEGRYRG